MNSNGTMQQIVYTPNGVVGPRTIGQGSHTRLPHDPAAQMQGQGIPQTTMQGQPSPSNSLPPPPPPQPMQQGTKGTSDNTPKNAHELKVVKNKKQQQGKREPRGNTSALKRTSATNSVSSDGKKKELTKLLTKEYKLNSNFNGVYKRGTKWMKHLPEDKPPRRLTNIPTDSKQNELEFVNWEPFSGKTSVGYILTTSKGFKFWVDAGSIQWLRSASSEGYMPGNCTFVVKHVKNSKEDTLHYGFHFIESDKEDEDEDIISSDSEEEEKAGEDEDAAF